MPIQQLSGARQFMIDAENVLLALDRTGLTPPVAAALNRANQTLAVAIGAVTRSLERLSAQRADERPEGQP